jgi:hypothetical protein
MLLPSWARRRSPSARRTDSSRRRSFRPSILALEERLTLTASITSSFIGYNGTGWTPPDTNIAVGPSHIVEVVNESVAIYDKATGNKLSSQTLSSFFSGFVSGDYGFFDPSVLYDEAAGRFVVEAQADSAAASKGYVDIAVSNFSDPTQGFTERQQIAVDEGGTVEPTTASWA